MSLHNAIHIAHIVQKLAEHNTCAVCDRLKAFSSWTAWTCCEVAQCSECAASTRQSKCCQNCGSAVK